MANVKPIKFGKTTRMSFSKIEEAIDMPNLIEIQKNSYEWFVKKGLKEVFDEASYILDSSGSLVLEFVGYRFDDEPKYSIMECKERDASFAVPLRVMARLKNLNTGEVKEQEVFMGEFPLMTPSGTFIIRGAERVVVSQLVRSPGVYYGSEYDKSGKKKYSGTMIPNRGTWLEFETDSNDIFYVRIDKNKKIPITMFIRALLKIKDTVSKGEEIYTSRIGTDEEIYEIFGNDRRINKTMTGKDSTKTANEAILELYKKLRPGEPVTLENAAIYVKNLFFDERRYDLSKVGRYKYNKKLALSSRVVGKRLFENVVNPETGELLAEKGEILTKEKVLEIEKIGINSVLIDVDGESIKVISNGMVNITDFVDIDAEKLGIKEKVRYKVLKALIQKHEKGVKLTDAIIENLDKLIPRCILKDDVFSAINYLNCLAHGIGEIADIDHLQNRRVRCVGELLQNQFRIGIARMERVIKERMTLQSNELELLTPQTVVNIRPIVAVIGEFFGSSPLSQFMDQTNPLAELTHKRRLSALGPGGLSRDRAGFEVRDVHYTHYGRMCPIETPEGPNIGLISYLALFARLNEYGFIMAPYKKVDKKTLKVTNEVTYMTADVEDKYKVAQANEELNENNEFINDRVHARHLDQINEKEKQEVDYMDVSMLTVL